MFLTQLLLTALEMLTNVLATGLYAVPFISILWSLSLIQENKRLPRTREDIAQLRQDLREFVLMNVLVLVVFSIQVVLVSVSVGLLGVKI